MPEIIDLAKARELLARAVETQGRGFIYNTTGDNWATCRYEPIARDESGRELEVSDPRTKTGCIVGVALSLHGETRHLHNAGSVMTLKYDLPGVMTWAAAEYFQAAQVLQDKGAPWGEAYDAAEARVEFGDFSGVVDF